MTTPLELPTEIIDRIFQLLDHSSGISSLKICSLVSSSFLLLSRRYLFQKVVLYITISCVDSTPLVYHNCLDFLSEDKHVASLIRDLTIVPHPPHVKLVDDRDPNQRSAQRQSPLPLEYDTAISFLHKIRRKAACLRHLSIHSNMLSDWTSIEANLRSAVLGFCSAPTLQSLELHHLGISTRELEYLVLHNSTITSIVFHGVQHTKQGMSIAWIPVPASVETKQPGNITANSLRLDIIIEAGGSASLMVPIVHKAGPRIRCLKWRSSASLVNEDTHFHLLNISQFSGLTELTIGIPLRSNIGLDDLNSILSGRNTIRDPSTATTSCLPFYSPLQSITLEFDCKSLPTEQAYSSWNWGILDSILSSRQFVGKAGTHNGPERSAGAIESLIAYPHLHSIVLSTKCSTTNSSRPVLLNQLFDIFQQNLPRTTGQGLLKQQTTTILA